MNADEFDKALDAEETVVEHLDTSSSTRPAHAQRRVNVDLPQWMIKDLDQEADRIGVTRQSIIKVWLAERLQSLASSARP